MTAEEHFAKLGIRPEQTDVTSCIAFVNAVRLAVLGFPVFVAEDGITSATVDLDTLRAAFRRDPHANWFVRTATNAPGIIAVEFPHALRRLPASWTILAPSKRGHVRLYFTDQPGDHSMLVKSAMLPGSVDPTTGERLRWARALAPGLFDVTTLSPETIADLRRVAEQAPVAPNNRY